MRRFPWELLASLLFILLGAGLYALAAQHGAPPPGSFLGHLLGVIGFLLMLATETLYTLRKRWRRFNVGAMSTWLQFHVFTGIAGPFLVLLHSAGKFHGLAGVVTWLTLLMVLSGFIGRYIYTAAPRTLEGVELRAEELEARITGIERELRTLPSPPKAQPLLAEPPQGWRVVLGRPWLRRRERRRRQRALRSLWAVDPACAFQLDGLLAARYDLRMQIHALAASRRLLALWHLFHIPLGAALFTLAFVHIGAALYYATFLK